MAYNKSKHVEAAQKLLNQGKVAQAIAEYQQILKYEPRDQVTLMTIGELYIRQGETFQAIEYFERLAQLFVSDGFLTKAIAVYKRIAKLAPEEIRPLEKLADLYVQQGVMSEARPLFLQLAELHLKNNKQAEAVTLLKKLLLAEPDNLRIQIRLADLYHAMGQTEEALECYISGAQRALARGEHAECEKLADKALAISPKNLDVMIVKARAFSSTGNFAQAADILAQVPDLDKGGEPAELLLDLYLKTAKWDEATSLALRILSADDKNFTATQRLAEALLEAGQGERAMSLLSRTRIPMIDAGKHEEVVHLLNELAARLPGRIEPLEWLVDTYGRTSDSFRLPDALAHFGDALAERGNLQRAKEVFEQLLDREPESDSAKRKLNQVLQKMGLMKGAPEAAPIPAPAPESLQAELPRAEAPKVRPGVNEPAAVVPAREATASPAGPDLDEETQKFIAQSLTDVDLFASYGLTQKAIGLLEAILRRAPMHAPTLEKLLDFVLGAGDDRRTAELAAQLEHIHGGRGDTRGAERFGELRRRFQRAAGLTDEEIATAVAAALPQPVETIPVEEPAVAEPEIAEAPEAVQAEAAVEAEVEEIPITVEESAPEVVAAEPVSLEEELPEIEIIEEAADTASAAKDSAPQKDEVDLSSEWASLLEETQEPAPAVPTAKAPVAPPARPANQPAAAEEFDLPEFMIEEEPASAEAKPSVGFELPEAPEIAPKAIAKHQELPEPEEFEVALQPEESSEEVDPFAEVLSTAGLTDSTEVQEVELSVESEAQASEEEAVELTLPQKNEIPQEPVVPMKAALDKAPETFVEAPELELDQDFELVLEPEQLAAPHEMMGMVPPGAQSTTDLPVGSHHESEAVQQPKDATAPGETARGAGGEAFTTDQFLHDLAKEMDELGLGELTPPEKHIPAAQEQTTQAVKPATGGESGPLKEVFDEFRAELGEMGAEDEDLETHYNLGIAFREMGLLEEAIGEFQKVAQANDSGRAFRYAMQCCTLLGLAFMEKGQPSIAAIWYERALQTPGIDGESKLALRYDLGVAQESAGDLDAALKSYSQVYAVNIDYRDVAERITSLHKPAR